MTFHVGSIREGENKGRARREAGSEKVLAAIASRLKTIASNGNKENHF